LSWLKNSLIKNAGQVLWDSSPESTDTLPKLIELLTNRFGGTKQTDKHRMELRFRKRRPNESLSDLHQDISRLMALAHHHLPSSSRDAIACDYYIDSLNDPDFALKVRERNPTSLDDVLRISLQPEAWMRDTNRQKGEDTGGKNKMREGRIVTVETGNSTEITAIKSQIDTLGKQFSVLMQHVNNQPVNYVQPVPTMSKPTVTAIPLYIPAAVKPMQWQQSSKPTANARPKACFNCGDPSHIKPQCPLLQSNVSNSYQTPVNVQSQSQQQGCFICGDPSHFRRNCPQWLKNNPTT